MTLLQRFATAFRGLTQGDTGFETPDITRAQQLALGQAVIAVLVVFGFDVDENTRDLILILAAAIGSALPIADAVVRQGRAKNLDAIQRAQKDAGEQEVRPQLSTEERRSIWAGLDLLER
jgi:hypothetical protein